MIKWREGSAETHPELSRHHAPTITDRTCEDTITVSILYRPNAKISAPQHGYDAVRIVLPPRPAFIRGKGRP